MADRSAWVAHAFLLYHAQRITLEELLAMVREHRSQPDEGTTDRDA